jgi:alginate O-acetyltransferase complex protein AlgI
MANQVFALPSDQLNFGYAWLGIACFTLQIYFDFSGYSDMALGLARMMGFNLRENFNMPYISESFTEFWRRWHISLSTWIRDYLYIPLGGNRGKASRIYINLWICFLLSGLWHGANWTFVLWGAYHGLFLVLDKWVWLKMHAHVPKIMRLAITLFLIMLGWVIFRSSDFTQMLVFFKALFNPFKTSQAYIDITSDTYFILIAGAFISLFPTTSYYKNISSRYLQWTWRINLEGILFGMLGLLTLCKILAASYTPFLYFKF